MFGYYVTNLKIFNSRNEFFQQRCNKCVVNWKFDKKSHPHRRWQAWIDVPFLYFIQIDYFNDWWSLKVSVVKMRLWSYYTNVYYKYIHGYFNIDNEISYLF
jgi:hypothetical protein